MVTTEATTESPTSQLVIETIAEAEGVDPIDLDVPLGEVIDPDALDALFTVPCVDERRNGTVEFVYCDYQVQVVSSDTRITVDVTELENPVAADFTESDSDYQQA